MSRQPQCDLFLTPKIMKKALTFLALTIAPVFVVATSASAAVYIRYSNQDSQEHVMKAQMDGQTKEITFEARTTGAATIQGSGTVATIETSCGKVEVKNESTIEIKNGCITVK
jgi:hypothetical protein